MHNVLDSFCKILSSEVVQMRFGDILRDLLEEHDITQSFLAKELNIAQSTIANYIRNEHEPDFSMLKKIANYFHVSTDYLLNNTTQDDYQLTADEQKFLHKYRVLNSDQKEMCLIMAQGFINQNQKAKSNKKHHTSV